MHETDEDQDLRYYKEISTRAKAEAKQYLLSLTERFKDSEADMASGPRYLAERLKEDEHKIEEGVCSTCGQPFSKHGDEEIEAPGKLSAPSNPSA